MKLLLFDIDGTLLLHTHGLRSTRRHSTRRWRRP
jgi:hydroxymethylpyrimidine pyrophosphatase-like HAD family hydrolase